MIPDAAPRSPHLPRLALGAALGALLAACGCGQAPRASGALSLREITPAFLLALDARDPALASDVRGRVALTWVTRDSGGSNVWLSVSADSGATFTAPVRVNLEPGRVVSFPEGRPLPALGPGGALAIAWSERRADATGAVDLRVRASADLGSTLGTVVTVNDDGAGPPPGLPGSAQRSWPRLRNPRAFHGFPALAFLSDGTLFAAWLDERSTRSAGEPRISSLYTSTSLDGGQTWSPNAALTDSACPCCRPSASEGPNGALALAYREASNDLRDPALALSSDGGRSFESDTVISRDRWTLEGCPDQGPGIVWNRPLGGTYLWLTGAEPAGVYAMPWRRDAGAAGLRRAITDSLGGARNAMIAALGDAALLGVESFPPGDSSRRVLALRVLEPGGTLSPWTYLGANGGAGWITGMGTSRALACWIEDQREGRRVRVVELTRRGWR